MKVMSKQAYCDMKCEEKGIDKKDFRARNGGPKTDGDRKGKTDRKANQKFNGLNELERLNSGRSANFAKIGDDVPVVGRPMPAPQRHNKDKDGESKKRSREDDGDEEKPAKREKPSHYEVDFQGEKVRVHVDTGAVIDPSEIKFVDGVVVKWTNSKSSGDWKEVKVGYRYVFR